MADPKKINEIKPEDAETVRVKPDVYIASLLDEANDHLTEIADLLRNGCVDDYTEDDACTEKKVIKKIIKKPSVGEVLVLLLDEMRSLNSGINALRNQYEKHYISPQTAIVVATPTKPASPDVIADASTPGYQIESVYNQLDRIAPRISVINDGTSNLFVIYTTDNTTWFPEALIAPGEVFAFFNVWELRLRSPVAGDVSPPASGGVYRITEYEISPRITVYDQQDTFGNNNTIGFSELAARLGSPMLYERRGSMLYHDDYESPTLKFTTIIPAGSTATATRSNDTAFMGTTSLKLVTGAVIQDFVAVRYIYMDFNDKTKVGEMVSFASAQTQADGFWTIIVLMDFFDGLGNQYRAQINYVPGQGKLDLVTAGGVVVNISNTLSFTADVLSWCAVKLVVDLNKKQYVRFVIFGQAFDISGNAMRLLVAPGQPRRLEYSFYLRADQAVSKTVYVDNHIMTDSEP